MENNRMNRKKRRNILWAAGIVSVCMVLFLCIFSLYHLPTRDPVETPEMVENPNNVSSPAGGFEETNDIMSASQEEVSAMLGDLEMQYENARLNGEPYLAQQDGLRLALAYWKAGQTQQAKNFVNSLLENYGYDEDFSARCKAMLQNFDTAYKPSTISAKTTDSIAVKADSVPTK